MLERYKLRLRDGTVLVVDHGALSTWLVDGKAMVQLVGSEHWFPLRQFLAKEKALAASAARRNPTPEEIPVVQPLPLVPPLARKPLVQALPLVPPPARDSPIRPLPPAPPPVSPPPPVVVSSPPPVVVSPPPPVVVSPPPPVVVSSPPPVVVSPPPPVVVSKPPVAVSPPPVLANEPPEVWEPEEESPLPTPPSPDDEVSIAATPSAHRFTDVPSPADSPEPPEVWAPTEEAAALYEMTAAELYESTARPPKPGNEDALWHIASQAMNEPPKPSPSVSPRNLQVLAEGAVASRAASKLPSSTSDDGLIPLKPLDDEEEASRRAAQPTIHEGDAEAEHATGLETSFLGLAPPWDARFSRWLDVLSTWVARLGRGLDRLTPRDPASMARAFLSRLRGVASLWTRSSGWVAQITRRDGAVPSQPTEQAVMAGTAGPALRKPLMPPPPLSEVPVLRLAKIDDSEGEQGGHDIYQEVRSLDVVWLWLKRITLIAGLLVAGIVAASTWETWLPAATQMARALFLEIHEREHPQVRELLPAVAEQLPHLAPETIALVMSRSPIDVLDPPEVFARAYDATERGLTALSAPEAEELGALQRALLDALLPAERQRVREYDLVRARRAPLPMENRDVLRSFANGARALPPGSRERLQELSGKAIAAALALPSDASPRAATAP
jgi:hypothetical protein